MGSYCPEHIDIVKESTGLNTHFKNLYLTSQNRNSIKYIIIYNKN